MILSALAALALAAEPPPKPRNPCFRLGSNASDSWTPVDDHTIVVDAGRQHFRIDVATCPRLNSPGTFIINKVRGSSLVCGAVDLDLSVADQSGPSIPTPCIAQGLSEITADEAKALHKKR